MYLRIAEKSYTIKHRAMEHALSVSELTNYIKSNIEQNFPDVLVQGEVSNMHRSHAGHWYWTLKDQQALISVVMFCQNTRLASFMPEIGKAITVRGSVSVYPPRGTYQIICTSISYTGDGEILLQLEQRKKKLAEKGLFDPSLKRPLPIPVKRAAIITSPHGAALQDVLRILEEQDMTFHLIVAPVLVQGERAAGSIIQALNAINKYRLADVIIICRGGGSLEDLLPFSDEALIRSVAASAIPVISAVGHETDSVLSDLAADFRVPTPTAAAQLLCEHQNQLFRRFSQSKRILNSSVYGISERYRRRLDLLNVETITHFFKAKISPNYLLLDDFLQTLHYQMHNRIADIDKRLSICRERLAASNPEMTLKQGYAILYSEQDEPIYSRSDLMQGQHVRILMHDGRAKGRIDELE